MADGQINIKFQAQGADKILQQLEQLEKKAQALQQALSQATANKGNNAQTNAQFAQLNSTISALKGSLDALRGAVNINSQGINNLSQQTTQLSSGVASATVAIDNATNALKQFNQGASTTKTVVQQVGQTTQTTSSAINEMLTKYFTWEAVIAGLQSVITKLQEVGQKAIEVSSKVREANRTAYSQLGEAGGNELARQRAKMGEQYGISEADMARYSQALLSAGMTDTGDVLRTLRASILNARRRGISIDQSIDKQKALFADAMDLGTVIEDIGFTDEEILKLGIKENADIEKSGNRDRLRRAIYEKELSKEGYLQNATGQESWERVKSEFENSLKEIGDMLLPVIQELSEALQKVISNLNDSPEVLNALKQVFTSLGDIVKAIIPVLGPLMEMVSNEISAGVSAFKTAMDFVATAVNSLVAAFYQASSRIKAMMGDENGARLAELQSSRSWNKARQSEVNMEHNLRKTIEGTMSSFSAAWKMAVAALSDEAQKEQKRRTKYEISETEKGATRRRYSVGDAQADAKAAAKAAAEAAKALAAAAKQHKESAKAHKEAAKAHKAAAKDAKDAAAKQAEAAAKALEAFKKRYEDKINQQESEVAKEKLNTLMEERKKGSKQDLKAQSDIEYARQAVLEKERQKIISSYAVDMKGAPNAATRSLVEQAQANELKAMEARYRKEWSREDKEFGQYAKTEEYKQASQQYRKAAYDAEAMANAMQQATASAQNFASAVQQSASQSSTNVEAGSTSSTTYNSNYVNVNNSPAASQTVSANAIRTAANQVIDDYNKRNYNNSL